MSLAARRPSESYYRTRINHADLIEMVEQTMHRYCRPGPMFLCDDDDCRAWVDALREWGVIR